MDIGNALAQEKEYERAALAFEHVLAHHRRHHGAYYNKGMLSWATWTLWLDRHHVIRA